ncbi:MAG: RIP metalloprotease [Chloroflexota bacterium]|nr:RIP metalloprotease [Chloroflexota bacterium]MDE2940856.1 RIP metalloprotease [Chloroflexota bacterium]MDE3267554.1 RIP metalloprotease [Chloroflexota bacterium]
MLGGLMVVVAFVVILMAHEGGHLVTAKLLNMKATKYFLGFGPTLWSFQRGETEYGVKAIPAGGYVRIVGMNALDVVEPHEEARAYRNKPFWQKSVVVMGGIATHFVIAFVLLWVVNVVIGEPDTSRPLLEVARVIPETEEGSPSAAALAGMLPGDRVVAVNGRPVDRWSDLSAILRSNPNQRVELDVLRDGTLVRLSATLSSRADAETGERVGFLGVSPRVERERDNPILGVGKAAGDVALYTRLSVQGIWLFATNLGTLANAVVSDDESLDRVRPVSVIGITQFGAASSQAGINVTLELIAYIAIFVGVLNAIPLFPFDGGHFVVALYEKVTGRPPDMRKVVPVGAAVFALVVMIGILGVYLDIARPLDLG